MSRPDENMKEALRLIGEIKALVEKWNAEHPQSPMGNIERNYDDDWSGECSMCGKPMSYRYCGMCTHCEMVWNG